MDVPNHTVSAKLKRLFAGTCIAVSLSACTPAKPFLIELPPDFEASARPIDVKTPSKRFRSKFFDIALGDYQVVNSRIKQFIPDNRRFALAKQEQKDSWLDLVLEGRLLPETTRTEFFGKAASREYRFGIAIGNQEKITSQCDMTRSVVVTEESTRDILGITNTKPRSGREEQGEWMQILYSCDLNSNGEKSTLSVMHNRGKKPVYRFESEKFQLQMAPMYNIVSPYYRRYEDAPVISDSSNNAQGAPGPLSGVTIFLNNREVAVVSLVDFENKIWISTELNDTETELLLGVSHSLILSSWLDG